LALVFSERDLKVSDAICLWQIAATSSKTGGYLYFRKAKMLTNPLTPPNNRLGFFIDISMDISEICILAFFA